MTVVESVTAATLPDAKASAFDLMRDREARGLVWVSARTERTGAGLHRIVLTFTDEPMGAPV